MATWFDIRIAAEDAHYAGQAAEEAFRLCDHLEGLLSRFREDSEVRAVAALKPGESHHMHPDFAACLSVALEISALTGGAFDPALGRALEGSGAGQGRLVVDREQGLVACEGAPVLLDLGAIGKGFALDRMAELLADWDAGPALLVAGGSSILATGAPAGPGWDIALTPGHRIELFRGSVGCSGTSVQGSHIIDPRSGRPASGPARAWALSGSAAVSDALSTAFMVLPDDEVREVCAQRPECAAILQPQEGSASLVRHGRGLGVEHRFVKEG